MTGIMGALDLFCPKLALINTHGSFLRGLKGFLIGYTMILLHDQFHCLLVSYL